MIKLETLDVSVIAIYFAIIFLTAFIVTRKEKKEENLRLLSARNLGWFLTFYFRVKHWLRAPIV